MLKLAKRIWDTMKITYGHRKKISRIGKIYEQIFTFRQADRLVQDYFSSLRVLLDELEIYQHFVVDISNMREYREELAVTTFL